MAVVADVLMLAGAALAAPACLLLVLRVHIPAVEARLRAHFGGWYSDCAAQVRRWM